MLSKLFFLQCESFFRCFSTHGLLLLLLTKASRAARKTIKIIRISEKEFEKMKSFYTLVLFQNYNVSEFYAIGFLVRKFAQDISLANCWTPGSPQFLLVFQQASQLSVNGSQFGSFYRLDNAVDVLCPKFQRYNLWISVRYIRRNMSCKKCARLYTV